MPDSQGVEDDLAYEPPPGAPGAGRGLLEKLLGTVVEEEPAPRPAPPARREAPPPQREAPPPQREAPPPRREAPPPQREAPRRPEPQPEEEDVPQDTGDEWWRQFFAEGTAFILFGAAPVAIDMACTVFGLTSTILPATRLGMVAAAVLHVFISIGQRHFLGQRSVVRWIGLLLLVINTALNVYGIMPVLDLWLSPDFLGPALPRDPAQWLPQLWAALWGAPSLGEIWSARWSFVVTLPEGVQASGLGGLLASMLGGGEAALPAWPSWFLPAALLTALCALIAWRAEPNLAWWYLRARHVWRRR
jgi:hypothetical protein